MLALIEDDHRPCAHDRLAGARAGVQHRRIRREYLLDQLGIGDHHEVGAAHQPERPYVAMLLTRRLHEHRRSALELDGVHQAGAARAGWELGCHLRASDGVARPYPRSSRTRKASRHGPVVPVRPITASGLPLTPAVDYDRSVSQVTLAIVEGRDAGQQFPLTGTMLIGRDPSADLVIADSEVSTRHASLLLVDGGAAVEDLDSTNGTFVNGQRVTGSQQLRAGDRIQLGATVLEVQGASAPAATEPAPRATEPAPSLPSRAERYRARAPPYPAAGNSRKADTDAAAARLRRRPASGHRAGRRRPDRLRPRSRRRGRGPGPGSRYLP